MAKGRIGVIGSGDVGQRLAAGFAAKGYEVKLGTREPKREDVQSWLKETGKGASVGTLEETAKFGELIVIATAWSGTENAIKLAGPANLKGKVVIDVTNPLKFEAESEAPTLAVGYPDSAGKLVQKWLPGAKVVKALNTVSNAQMVKPDAYGKLPDMFIAGDDAAAKARVTKLLQEFGWPVLDMGGIDQSYLLEALAMVWIRYGFQTNTWGHALKLIRE